MHLPLRNLVSGKNILYLYGCCPAIFRNLFNYFYNSVPKNLNFLFGGVAFFVETELEARAEYVYSVLEKDKEFTYGSSYKNKVRPPLPEYARDIQLPQYPQRPPFDVTGYHQYKMAQIPTREYTHPEYIAKRLSPAGKKIVDYVSNYPSESFHPWYPSYPEFFDHYWKGWDKLFSGINKQYQAIPPRIPLPYGKPLTVVIDTEVFYYTSRTGSRPGIDRLLGSLISKYEVILYCSKVPDNFEIDRGDQLASYKIYHGMVEELPFPYLKQLNLLNRPLDSTLIIHKHADDCYANPSNALVFAQTELNVKAHDNSLVDLGNLLEHIAKQKVEKGIPVPETLVLYQSVERDCITQYKFRNTLKPFANFIKLSEQPYTDEELSKGIITKRKK